MSCLFGRAKRSTFTWMLLSMFICKSRGLPEERLSSLCVAYVLKILSSSKDDSWRHGDRDSGACLTYNIMSFLSVVSSAFDSQNQWTTSLTQLAGTYSRGAARSCRGFRSACVRAAWTTDGRRIGIKPPGSQRHKLHKLLAFSTYTNVGHVWCKWQFLLDIQAPYMMPGIGMEGSRRTRIKFKNFKLCMIDRKYQFKWHPKQAAAFMLRHLSLHWISWLRSWK